MTIEVHVLIDRFLTMGKKTKGKIAKPRETSRRGQGDTARAGEGDEPSKSHEHEDPFDAGFSGDEDTLTPQLSKLFTDQQDKQIATFFAEKYSCNTPVCRQVAATQKPPTSQ